MSALTFFLPINVVSSEITPHTWGIFGGGFGLYGYLPAIARQNNVKVLILEKHFYILESRPELRQYATIVRTVKSRDEIFLRADSLIFSVPPQIQEKLLGQAALMKRYRFIVLEKPLATTPVAAMALLKSSIKIASSVRVGYSFLYSSWGKTIQQSHLFLSDGDFKISWKFLAHHFRGQESSWKSDHKSGGGVLRFYGIHLIAFFQSLNKTAIVNSRLFCNKHGQPFRWQAKFKIHNGARITVDLNSRSQVDSFGIRSLHDGYDFEVQGTNPFSGEGPQNNEDSRIPVIEKLLATFGSHNGEFYRFYDGVNQLWSEVERITEWVPNKA